jgi:hypothetical protein
MLVCGGLGRVHRTLRSLLMEDAALLVQIVS